MIDVAAMIRAAGERIAAAGESEPRLARDPVNLPLIENWVEAIGDTNPVYTDQDFATASAHGGLVAPPAMIQVWTMQGQASTAGSGTDPTGLIVSALDEAGYTSVVATNCDQVYRRYLRHGEQLTARTSLIDLVGPKRTALGEGWFFTTRTIWYSGDEPVATMNFRILKFRPPKDGQDARPVKPAQPDLGPPMRPVLSPDTAFFWAGTAIGELRIQSCGDCGALRHPPGPMCMECGSPNPKYVVAAGTGEVFSYVVHHHPPVPGKRLPIVIALVELTEGVRVLAEMTDVKPDEVKVGMPVKVAFDKVDDELTLPAWRPARSARPSVELPPLTIDVSTTFVIASALATRDFTKVHHDRDFAVASGSNDIFVNILTTTGLVQRFVSGWAGPRAIFRSISIRLGAPCYAGDTLTFTGEVTGHTTAEAADEYEVAVTGRCGLGDHVTSSVRIDVPRRQS
ncbi:MAG TPA: OB-fold domain-containing protein [Streptosporangiaceae bacterium]|nr:OB-fold domain-containing protein [Streptosporangiaceae bacterium]